MGLAQQLWTRFARQLGRTARTVPGTAPRIRPGHRTRVRRTTGHVDPATFADVLSDLIDRGLDRKTRLHVFSLSDFRAAVGGKWDKVQGLVEVAADTIVCKHIDLTRDIFTRLDGETSCLAMPQASVQETQTRVAAIAQDLAVYLFGNAIVQGRSAQVVAAHMPLHTAMDGSGGLDRPAIQRAIEDALAVAHRGTLTNLLAPDAAARLASDDRPVFAISGNGGRPPPGDGPQWLPVPPLPPRRQTAEAPDWLETQLEQQAQDAVTRARPMAPETNLGLNWIPVWVTCRQAIGAFHAQVIRADADPAPALAGAQAYAGAAPIEALTLDRFVATQAASELKALFIGQHRTGLTVPVHWMSLAPRWRDCVRIPFADCPVAARRKLLKIEVFGLTAEIPAPILHRLFEPLELVGCDVMARLPLTAMDMIPLLRGVRAVGVDLGGLEDDHCEDELFVKLARFRDAARQSKAACYVWGIQRRPLIVRLSRAGFSLLSGPCLSGPVSRPVAAVAGNRAA